MIADLAERYRQGADPEQVKREARAVLAFVRPEIVALAERELAQKQLGPEVLRELHRLHLDDLRDSLARLRVAAPPWHPVRTMLDEHDEILRTLERLEALNARVQRAAAPDPGTGGELAAIADNLLAAECHHQREEQVVFPELARRGISATVEAMEAEHAELRQRKHALKDLAAQAEAMDFAAFRRRLDELAQFLVYNLGDHIYKENHIIFPAALRLIADVGLWTRLKERCDEIGYPSFRSPH